MKRTTPVLMLALAALAFGCSKSGTDTKTASTTTAATGADGADAADVTKLQKQVKKMNKRLKKIERVLAQALNRPPDPDPAATYAMPVSPSDPWIGAEHAQVTIVEGFEFA